MEKHQLLEASSRKERLRGSSSEESLQYRVGQLPHPQRAEHSQQIHTGLVNPGVLHEPGHTDGPLADLSGGSPPQHVSGATVAPASPAPPHEELNLQPPMDKSKGHGYLEADGLIVAADQADMSSQHPPAELLTNTNRAAPGNPVINLLDVVGLVRKRHTEPSQPKGFASTGLLPSQMQQIQEGMAAAAADASRKGGILSRAQRAKAARQRIEDKRNAGREGGSIKALDIGVDVACLAWRQTADCSHTAQREPENDRTCMQRISHGASGYCEVIDNRDGQKVIQQTMHMNCSSFPAKWQMKNPWRCSDAPEFFIYSEDSVKYRAPDSLQLMPLPPPGESLTRGIVMGINGHTLVSAYAAIKVLRGHGCSLPIELWHLPDELNANHPIVQDLLAEDAQLKPIDIERSKLAIRSRASASM